MGRKKIEITKINDERNRQITFNKRKLGLMKKAYELSVLCGCDVGLIIFEKQVHQYSNVEIEGLFERFKEVGADEKEVFNNADMDEQFGAKAEEMKRLKAMSFNAQPGVVTLDSTGQQQISGQGQPPQHSAQGQTTSALTHPQQMTAQQHQQAQLHQQHPQRSMPPGHYPPRPSYSHPSSHPGYPSHYSNGPPRYNAPPSMHWQHPPHGQESAPSEYIQQHYSYPARPVMGGQVRPPQAQPPPSQVRGAETEEPMKRDDEGQQSASATQTTTIAETTVEGNKLESKKRKHPNMADLNISIPSESIAVVSNEPTLSGEVKGGRANELLGEDLGGVDLLVTPRLRARTPRVKRGAEHTKGGMFDDDDDAAGSDTPSSPSLKKKRL
eukprot:CFRG0708T1